MNVYTFSLWSLQGVPSVGLQPKSLNYRPCALTHKIISSFLSSNLSTSLSLLKICLCFWS